MGLTHLVDASVLKRLARSQVRAVVESLAEDQRVARASISDLELGYSARTAAEWDEGMVAMGELGLVATDRNHVARAITVQRLLAERSQRGRDIPDLLVAAAAEIEGLTVLHYDADFDRIAAVTGQPVEWVVPRGSVD